eukprot:COSAG02_NODE_2263_length_9312_cov_3.608054_12_plen_78_part_00
MDKKETVTSKRTITGEDDTVPSRSGVVRVTKVERWTIVIIRAFVTDNGCLADLRVARHIASVEIIALTVHKDCAGPR